MLSAMNARALTCRHNGRRYDGIIKLTRRLNSKFPTNRETQERTVGILASLFPSWLPSAFKVSAQGQLQLRSQAASPQGTQRQPCMPPVHPAYIRV